MIREITNVTTSNPSKVGANHSNRWTASASNLMGELIYAISSAGFAGAIRAVGEASKGASTAPSEFYLEYESQRISWPLPIGLKRMPSRFLAQGPKYFVL